MPPVRTLPSESLAVGAAAGVGAPFVKATKANVTKTASRIEVREEIVYDRGRREK